MWIVDPIDGTQSYIDGYPEFCVSVGLVDAGWPVVGVVFNPATDEMFSAVAGRGSTRNGRTIRVQSSAVDHPLRMVVSRSELRRGDFDFLGDGWTLLPVGSTTYKMMKVADGSADAFLSRRSKSEWDVCAAALIVTEAGGRVSDASGAALRYNRAVPSMAGVFAGTAAADAALRRILPI